jgi:hypothetical protein
VGVPNEEASGSARNAGEPRVPVSQNHPAGISLAGGEAMSATTTTTTDHEAIRGWAEERGGKPSQMKSTATDNETGILRIDFPGYEGDDRLEEISWEQFFEKFEESQLALILQEETSAGETSNFNKFVKRE